MIIGITGKSGSGKSTIANIIGGLNKDIKVVHVDDIGHEVLTYKNVIKEMIKAFGLSIIDSNGNIDRKKVGELVFNNRHKMQILTDITWKHMDKIINDIIKNNNFVILDWILLPETKYFKMCDVKILVDATYEIRKAKAISRDHISEEKFDEREKASIEYDPTIFDYVINNDFIIENKKKECEFIYEKSNFSRKF